MKDNEQGMTQKPLVRVSRRAITAILLIFLVAGCLYLGVVAQEISTIYLALGIAALAGWVFYTVHTSISLQSTLLILALFFIRPLEFSFYLILLLLLVVFLAELIMKEGFSLVIPYPSAMAILLGFSIYSVSKITNPAGIKYFVSTAIVPFMVLTLFSNARIKDNLMIKWMQYIVWVAVFVAAYGIFIAIRNPFARLGSFWFTAMTINGFYTVGFFFALTLALRNTQQLTRFLYIAASICIMFGMFYTYTRMAILAVAVGVFLYMLKEKRIRLLGIILLGLIPLITPSSMVSRIELGFQSDVSLIIRAIAWYIAVGQIIKHPITGIGFSVWADWYHTVVPVKMLDAQHCHNVYLNMLVEIGIFGTLAYFSIVINIIRQFWKARIRGNGDLLPYGMWVAMMALLFSCLTDIFIQQYSVSLLFWINLGIMMALSKETRLE